LPPPTSDNGKNGQAKFVLAAGGPKCDNIAERSSAGVLYGNAMSTLSAND
jgi:hypothetical protein